MAILESILKPVRERSGSIASNRFSFQQDWSLCKLISMEESGKDYVLIFEHDDDLITLDSPTDPKKVNFFQIKTKNSGNWTATELIKQKNGSSILGKLYSNKIKYGDDTESLNFISNAKFKISLNGSGQSITKNKICVVECEKAEFNKISQAIKNEHVLSVDPECNLIFLNVDDLALNDSGKHATGIISNFLYNIDPHKKYKPTLIYVSLINEIKRRCNYEHPSGSLEELKKNKGITKKQFTGMLKVMVDGEDKRFEQFWSTTSQRLNQEQEDVRVIEKIRRCGTEYDSNITDHTNQLHKDLCRCVKEIIDKLLLKNNSSVSNLKEFLNEIVEEFKKSTFNQKYPEVYTDEYIKAVALSKYYE